MTLRLFVLTAALAGSLACNQAPGPAPAGTPTTQDTPAGAPTTRDTALASAPTTQDTASAATVPSTGSGGVPARAATVGMAPAASAAAPAVNPVGDRAKAQAPSMMEMEVPAGTALEIVLETPVSSATNRVEDAVRGRVARSVAVSGMTTIPEGSAISGTVVEAKPSGKVQGRALIALRFNRVIVANTPYTIRTTRIVREAAATKGEDAKKVGIGAGAGAVIGAIAGGKKGALIGTAVGAGAGTGAVLATKGQEVSLGSGATLRTTIEDPVRINAPM